MVELSAEGTGLGVEDSGVGAAAVEAEEAGKPEGGVGEGVGLLCDYHDGCWVRAPGNGKSDRGRRDRYKYTDKASMVIMTESLHEPFCSRVPYASLSSRYHDKQ